MPRLALSSVTLLTIYRRRLTAHERPHCYERNLARPCTVSYRAALRGYQGSALTAACGRRGPCPHLVLWHQRWHRTAGVPRRGPCRLGAGRHDRRALRHLLLSLRLWA